LSLPFPHSGLSGIGHFDSGAGLLSRSSSLQIEVLALRHELNVLERSVKPPKLTASDRCSGHFWQFAILSIALGIGANTAIFGLVDAVMLRMLPVRDSGSLVFIHNVGSEGANGGPPYPCFELFRDQAACSGP
jgi:hypothetical protein